MRGIVICTTTKRLDWLNNCLKSFNGYNNYPILSLMVDNGVGFVPDFLRACLDLNLDEFVLLQDSMEVKDPSVFDICFEEYPNVSVSLSSTPTTFGSTHGKFIWGILEKCSIPKINNKRDDALFEVSFGNEYAKNCQGRMVELADLPHTNNFVDKLGRKNMVVENQWIRKFKGTWTLEMAEKL